MKLKTLVILLGILVILAGAWILLQHVWNTPSAQKDMGTPFLKELPFNQTARIILKSTNTGTVLVKNEGRWVVESYYRFSADFEKITQMIRKLKEAKIGRSFPASADVLSRLSLRDPDDAAAPKEEKAIRLELKDEKDGLLAKILIGKPRSGDDGGSSLGEGQYVMLNQEAVIYLIDKDLTYLEQKPADWLDNDISMIDSEEVRSIRCLSADDKKQYYAFERPAKGKDLAPIGFTPPGTISRPNLISLSQFLYGLRIEDVENPEVASKIGFARHFAFQLFNGLTYHLYLGDTCSNQRCPLKINVTYQQPRLEEEKKATTGTTTQAVASPSAPPPKTPEEMTQEAKDLNARLADWICLISEFKRDNLVQDIQGLLEKPKTVNKAGSKPVVAPKKTK